MPTANKHTTTNRRTAGRKAARTRAGKDDAIKLLNEKFVCFAPGWYINTKDDTYQAAWKRFYVAKPNPGEGSGWLHGTQLVLMTSSGRLLTGRARQEAEAAGTAVVRGAQQRGERRLDGQRRRGDESEQEARLEPEGRRQQRRGNRERASREADDRSRARSGTKPEQSGVEACGGASEADECRRRLLGLPSQGARGGSGGLLRPDETLGGRRHVRRCLRQGGRPPSSVGVGLRADHGARVPPGRPMVPRAPAGRPRVRRLPRRRAGVAGGGPVPVRPGHPGLPGHRGRRP